MADIDPEGSTVGTVLRMRLFGPSSFAIGGRELRFKSLKLRAALGYIALSESQTETRERLVGMLWSESGEDHARASLRQNIRELRVALDGSNYSGLYIAAHEIGFESDTVSLDVLTVLEAAEAGQVHPLLLERRNLADELLAGLEDLDPSFRSWLLAKRHTVRDRLLRALENALADEGRDLAEQGNLSQAILNLDPTHEDAARRLMRARAMVGDTAGALRVYKALWDLLDEDYGMEPADATQKLVADIKTGRFEPPAGVRPPDTVSVAGPVPEPATHLWLSVQTVSIREVDPAKAHLVLEFRQHLIASLLRFREWRVTDAPARTQAGDHLLTGHYEVQMTANQTGPDVHMMITLKDLEHGLYIWNESFGLKLENWFDYQRHVIRRIKILPAGIGQTLTAVFTPFDAVDYAEGYATTTINVQPAPPPGLTVHAHSFSGKVKRKVGGVIAELHTTLSKLKTSDYLVRSTGAMALSRPARWRGRAPTV